MPGEVVPDGTDENDVAELAGVEELPFGAGVMGSAALLHAALEGEAGGCGGGSLEAGAIPPAVDGRLFEVDVLAGGEGVTCKLNVEVVGGGDEDGIYVVAGEEVLVTDEDGGLGEGVGEAGLEEGGLAGVDVAEGCDADARIGEEACADAGSAAAEADDAEADAVVSAEDLRVGFCADGGESDQLQKPSPGWHRRLCHSFVGSSGAIFF